MSDAVHAYDEYKKRLDANHTAALTDNDFAGILGDVPMALQAERDAAIKALELAPEAIENIYDMLDFIQAQSPQSAEGLRYVHIRTARFQEALKKIDTK